jgi:hypothetical protein
VSKVLVGIKVSSEVKMQLDALKHPGQSLGGVIQELLQHVQACDRAPKPLAEHGDR